MEGTPPALSHMFISAVNVDCSPKILASSHLFFPPYLSISSSLRHIVLAALSKDAAAGGRRQEFLFAVLSVLDFLGKFLGRSGHGWFLARVVFVISHHHTGLGKVQLDVFEVLVAVKSDLDAASSEANALHVVLIEGGRDNVTRARHLFDSNRVNVGIQVLKLEVDDARLAGGYDLVVGSQARLARDRVVAGEHCLLNGFRLTASDREGLGLFGRLLSLRACLGPRTVHGGTQVRLLLTLGRVTVIVGTHLFLATHALFEFVISLATLGLHFGVVANVVDVLRLLRDRGILLVVGLFEHGGGELLLTLAERVHVGGAGVDDLSSASFSLPVGVGAECISLSITVVVDRGTVRVATSEDARLKLLVLFVASVKCPFLVLSFHG